MQELFQNVNLNTAKLSSNQVSILWVKASLFLVHPSGGGSSFKVGGQVEADSRGGVLGAPSPPARGLRERCNLPQRGSGRNPNRKRTLGSGGPENEAGGCKYHLVSFEQHCH